MVMTQQNPTSGRKYQVAKEKRAGMDEEWNIDVLETRDAHKRMHGEGS